jgi:hypothetical protein
MIITKVTIGFVCQRFDTETRKFVGQEFISDDDVNWEHEDGTPVRLHDDEAELVYGQGGVDEPNLNPEMVQPKGSGVIMDATPLLAKSTSFEVGEKVLVMPSDDPDDLVRNEFIGTVVSIQDGKSFVAVKDADDNVFDCDPVQLHHVM